MLRCVEHEVPIWGRRQIRCTRSRSPSGVRIIYIFDVRFSPVGSLFSKTGHSRNPNLMGVGGLRTYVAKGGNKSIAGRSPTESA
jgi:hypothetical protein